MDSPLTDALGWALLHFLWQGAAIAIVAWVLLRLPRKPGGRYLVAVIAMALMPLSFAITSAVVYQSPKPLVHTPDGDLIWRPSGPLARSIDQPGRATSPRGKVDRLAVRSALPQTPAPSAETNRVTETPEFGAAGFSWRPVVADWLPFLVGCWLAGVIVLSIRLLGGWNAARRLTRHGIFPANPDYQRLFQQLLVRLGVRRAVRLLESTIASVPSVVGWLRPVILLPASALTGLTPAQIELLLAHELAHVRRHDYLVNLIQCAVETLLFYHPAIWWLSQRVREERELCCDDIAVSITGDARQYAEALVALERLRVVPELAMAATGGALLPRIRRLLDADGPQVEIFPRWIAGGLVVAFLAVGAVGAGLPQLDPMGSSNRPAVTPLAGASDTGFQSANPVSTPADTGKVVPDTVVSHPDPSRPLSERIAWANARGKTDKKGYYAVYTISPVQGVHGAFFIGNGIFFSTGSGNTIFSGTIVSIGDKGSFNGPGHRLISIIPAQPDQLAIILSFNGDRVDDAAGVSLPLPYDFHGRPVYWLGAADQSQSFDLLRSHFQRASTVGLREMLVRLIGVHETSDQVVGFLVTTLQGNEAADVREQAAEWLGRHPTRRSLEVLDGAARRDRNRDVRKEAAESVGDLVMPEAFDVLVRLARDVDDAEVRQEAVEALGERPEAGAAAVLGDIALHDRDRDVQREATETLGDLSDARGLAVLKGLVSDHPVSDVRQEAVETWAEAAPVDQAVDLLAEVIRDDPSQDVRNEAVEDLIDLRDGKGLAIVRKLAREHRDPELRREAVEDLPPHLGFDEAISFLREVILNDPSTDVRREAVETLGDLHDSRVVPVLVEMLQRQTDDDVVMEAAETLGEISDPAALDALINLANNHRSDDVMAEAVETLGERNSGDGLKAVADIAARHPRSRVRAEAVETYGEHAPGAEALALFRKLAPKEQSEEVLAEIFETALELKGADGVGFVMEVVKNSRDRYVQRVAADELKDSDDRRAKALVRELKLDD